MAKLSSSSILFTQDTIDFISSLMTFFQENSINLEALSEPVVTLSAFNTWLETAPWFSWYDGYARYDTEGTFTEALSFNGKLYATNLGMNNKGKTVKLQDGELVVAYSSSAYKVSVEGLACSFDNSKIDQIRPVTYFGSADTQNANDHMIGFIEEELRLVDDRLTVDGGVDTMAMLAVLVEEVKNLRLRVSELETK